LTKAGCKFVFWVADWFALLNNKMGGDINKIQTVGRYMIEVWKAAGMDMKNVEFLWASEEINKRASEYWLRVSDIASTFTLTRIKRCGTIMGKDDMKLAEDDVPCAHIMYPIMQCADIFFLKADICQLGMDQRKVNMLARDYADHKKKKEIRFKPIIISHHMIMGLKYKISKSDPEKAQPIKMSKSDPESAIFMEDTPEDVENKIAKALCPQTVENNPILDYLKHIIFIQLNFKGILMRTEDNIEKTYHHYEDVEIDFLSGKLSTIAVKSALTKALNEMLDPVRKHFATNPEAKVLLETVKIYIEEMAAQKARELAATL